VLGWRGDVAHRAEEHAVDASRFDAWTRRRLNRATGALAILLGAWGATATLPDGHARKRCKRRGAACTRGERRACCGDLTCRQPTAQYPSGETHCCYQVGDGPCRNGGDCCYPAECVGDTCLATSDQELKTNLASVDAADLLARVRELPISTWNYTVDDPAVRHIGPMAQDFAALFGVGSDDRHIHPLDGQGIALAAIQALAAQLEALQADNARLAARIAELEEERDRERLTVE
jgi:hypothetical protein